MALRPKTTGESRYEKWSKRFSADSQSVSPSMSRLTGGTVIPSRVANAFNDLVANDEAVRAVLDLEGISVLQYAFYLGFGRQMWKLTSRIAGETAAVEAANLIGLWVARGLSQTILETIRTQVFGVSAPSP